MITLYGIKNCDTIQKARRWLTERGVEYRFHDYRADGLDAELLNSFIRQAGWRTLLNTRSATWRTLDEIQRNSVSDAGSAAKLLLEMPTIIKRPLLCAPGKTVLVGFSASRYQQFFDEA